MNKKLISAIAAGVLVLATCGSDSDSGTTDSGTSAEAGTTVGDADSGAGSDQEQAADAAIAAAKAEGIELDEDCVNELAGQLSDEDAKAIVAAGTDGDADVSAEGEAIGTQLIGCADNDQIIDLFITQMEASGQDFDEDCVRDNMKDLDLAELTATRGGRRRGPRGSDDCRHQLLRPQRRLSRPAGTTSARTRTSPPARSPRGADRRARVLFGTGPPERIRGCRPPASPRGRRSRRRRRSRCRSTT